VSDETKINEVLQAIHDAEQAGDPATTWDLAERWNTPIGETSTRVFPTLNAGYAECDLDGGALTLTDAGRARIGVTDGGGSE